MAQVCFKCSSGIEPSSEAAAWLITRTARVLQVWFRCGSVWFKCSSGIVPSREAAALLITLSAH
eukprot:5699952-Pyramimonas_sp.AAC.1